MKLLVGESGKPCMAGCSIMSPLATRSTSLAELKTTMTFAMVGVARTSHT